LNKLYSGCYVTSLNDYYVLQNGKYAGSISEDKDGNYYLEVFELKSFQSLLLNMSRQKEGH
jgi:hypothetical protein